MLPEIAWPKWYRNSEFNYDIIAEPKWHFPTSFCRDGAATIGLLWCCHVIMSLFFHDLWAGKWSLRLYVGPTQYVNTTSHCCVLCRFIWMRPNSTFRLCETYMLTRRSHKYHRLFHAPTRTTSSGCFMLHRTVHALWNLYGNPYRNRAETEEETIP